jgi:nitrate/nitrite transporter NarK
LPTKFLQGTPAAAGIALINGLGSTGGFFGPSIIGFLRQTTGSDVGAFVGIAALALIGALALVALRQLALLRPQQAATTAVAA